MSKINLTPNASGTGVFTIASPNSNTDYTINLPEISGGEFVATDASGNVGIGGAPVKGDRKFMVKDTTDVRVDIRSGNDTSLGAIDFSDTSNTARGQIIYDHSDDSLQVKTLSTERMRIDSSGRLLVGTTSAYAQNARHCFEGLAGVYALGLKHPTPAGHWKVGPNASDALNIINENDVGVKVNSGSTAWSSSSDINLKENVSDIGSVLEKVIGYQCINYSLKQNELDKANAVGFVAQDWKKDFPSIVTEDENGELSMKYTETIPVLLKAIQEQQAVIEDLESRLSAVEAN